MAVTAVVGGQWGDEGKGKVIDLLAGTADVVIRAHGGDNAGHTVVNDLGEFALHLVPAGIFNPAATCIIAPGVALNPAGLVRELEVLEQRGVRTDGLLISDRAHLVMPYHLMLEQAQEGSRGADAIGSTGRGIGPTYGDKVGRIGIRAGDLRDAVKFRRRVSTGLAHANDQLRMLGRFDGEISESQMADEYLTYASRLREFIRDVSPIVAGAISRGAEILLEGAQGTLLDLDHGTYPYATTSACTVAGLCQGSGVPPQAVDHSVGVYKAYCTRVGSGPMPTELKDGVGDYLRERAHEFGTTTGRARRCGWFDAVVSRYTARLNGFSSIALTRLDILDELETISLCVAYDLDGSRIQDVPYDASLLERCRPVYEELPGWKTSISDVSDFEELPREAMRFVERVEHLVGAPADMIGVGPARRQTISRGRFRSAAPFAKP
ncbi:MAG: adenylosuccinate synthase [Chloroflexi bacterium]|nr:adenylosuccinate synthase [Chloroflexota bacterium]